MNKLDSIIDKSLNKAYIHPCDFSTFRFYAKTQGSNSGLHIYYRIAEEAFRHPEKAKRILQYLLTNLSAMITQSVCVGHAITDKDFEHESTYMPHLRSLYEEILSDRRIIDIPGPSNASNTGTFAKDFFIKTTDVLETVKRKSQCERLSQWYKELLSKAKAQGCINSYSTAGLFQYATLWRKTDKSRRGDPTTICQKLMRQLILPCRYIESDNSKCDIWSTSGLIEFVFQLRNDIVHRNHITCSEEPVYSEFRTQIKQHYPNITDYRHIQILTCIAMTLAMPYVVSGLLNEHEKLLKNNAPLLKSIPYLWAIWAGPFPKYPVIDPVLGPTLRAENERSSHKSAKKHRGRNFLMTVKNSLSFIIAFLIQTTLILAIAVFCRGVVHNCSGNGFGGFTKTDEIKSYVETMNNYDRALLYDERMDYLKSHPEFVNEERENELSRRLLNENWPKPSFFHTMWHIGTPRWLHWNDAWTNTSKGDSISGTEVTQN